MEKIFKKMTPARILAMGFATVIIIGSLLLMLPFSVNDGVNLTYIDALYTATSAVCVTGLVVVDTLGTFSFFGQFVIAMLIEIGGLGVTSIGAGIILAMGKKVDIKNRTLIKEAMNLDSGKGVVKFVKNVLLTTLTFQLIGAVLSFIVFVKDYPPLEAIWVSVFHSIAAFNNAGFDILGNMENMKPYTYSTMLNLTTTFLIFFGGIGFLVIREMLTKKFNFKHYSMHAKVVLSTTVFLIISGTLLLKITEGSNISWLGAYFTSVSSRTAGFSTYQIGDFKNASLLVITALMIIGASPGSTGGGIKTSTFFVLLQGIKASATNTNEKAFRYSIPKTAFRKAAVIALLALGLIGTSAFLITIFEPNIRVIDAIFEMASAFGTVGLSTGITPNLCIVSKIITILVMFTGRLGPLTIASIWAFSRGERVRFPEGNIAIG